MYKLVLPFIIALLLTASCKDSQPETGNIFTVTVSEGSGPGTLYAAIRNANMEDEPCKIVFSKVNYITLKEELPEISCSVTIDGGKDGVTIDAEGQRRIFIIVKNEITPEASFSNLTLTGGYSDDGGGAIDCSFDFYSISVNDCVFKNNKAKGRGGAIFSKSPVNIEHCAFNGNESSWGGAIYIVNSLHIQHSIFERNKALSGGAITGEYPFAGIYLSDCVFSNNEADYDGEYGNRGSGGAIVTANALYIFNSLFFKNRTNGRGGAIHLDVGNQFICMNSTFVENSADGRGGAICTGTDFAPRPTFAHKLLFAYCTFFGNKSGGLGGAVFGAGECFFLNNIFTGNQVSTESTDYYGNALTGNHASPEASSDFFAGYLYMAYNIYDRFYYDKNTFYIKSNVRDNVQATAMDVFGTERPQLKDNTVPVLSNGPANGLGRPVCIDLLPPHESFKYRDNGKWYKVYDGNEYAITKNDSIITSDQTGFKRPENNITVGAWQIR